MLKVVVKSFKNLTMYVAICNAMYIRSFGTKTKYTLLSIKCTAKFEISTLELLTYQNLSYLATNLNRNKRSSVLVVMVVY